MIICDDLLQYGGLDAVSRCMDWTMLHFRVVYDSSIL